MYEVSAKTKLETYALFGRTEKTVNQDIEIVRNWIKNQPHLPEVMEDVKILNFLLLNKFSIEKTKKKIDMYYTVRSVMPHMYENCNPKLPNIKKVFESVYVSTHPKAVNGSHRVYICKLKQSQTWNPLDYFRLWFNIHEVRLYEDFMVNDIIVCDLSGFSIGDMRKMTPSLTSNFLTIYKQVYALRIKHIFYINSPSYVTILVNMLKVIMKPKVFERLKVCHDAEILNTIFDKDSLPKDYGGNGPSLDELNNMMMEKLDEYQDRFDKLDTLRVDESLRPEKLRNDELLGFYGNFRNLDVD